MTTFDQCGQIIEVQANVAGNMYIYARATPRPVDPETLAAAARQLAALPLETIPDPAPLPPGSRMPLSRNPLFVGREADLRALATALMGGETAAIGQTAAASGLGGIGKTQLASEFVHRYGQYFAGGVFWLSFAEPAPIPTEVATCGGPGALALHPEFHILPLADQVQLVHAAWQSPLPRLLVFDNCGDEALLAQWRPPHGGCRVLVTSRRAQWERSLGVQLVPLGILPRDESLALLHRHRPDLGANDMDLDAIAAELGDLPLALHLAGSFLARYRQAVTPATYLAQLRQRDLLAHPSLQGRQLTRALSPTQHEQHVARTFALSYDRLDPADAIDVLALVLLARAARFALGQPIPRDLLLATIAGAEEALDAALQAEDALRRLLELGLLEPEAPGTVRLHRLLAVFVQEVTRDVAAQTVVEDVLLTEANRLFHAGYPGALLALYPHLQAMVGAALSREEARTARLNMALGTALYLLGDYASAQPAYERALALLERVWGPDHPNVATSLNNLAALYYAQGRLAEAIADYDRAIALKPDDAYAYNNRGNAQRAQGRLAEAIADYDQAIALKPDYARPYYNRGNAQRAQGHLAGAIADYDQAIALKPDYARAYYNRGNVRGEQDDLAGAIADYDQAIALKPDYARAYYNRGNVRGEQDDLAGAIADYDQAIALEPDYAYAYNNRGNAQRAQGRLAEAIADYDRAIALKPDDARAYYNRGNVRGEQGDLAGAIADYDQAIALEPSDPRAYNNRRLIIEARTNIVPNSLRGFSY